MSAWDVIAWLVAMWLGWMVAHLTVATECERLGAFYVGQSVYQCGVKR